MLINKITYANFDNNLLESDDLSKNIMLVAKEKIEHANIKEETRDTLFIIKDLLDIYLKLKPRLNSCKEFKLVQPNKYLGISPIFITDEVSGQILSTDFVLSPCNFLNEIFSKLLDLTKQVYSPKTLTEIINLIKLNPTIKLIIKDLRHTWMYYEELIENQALNLIIKTAYSQMDFYKKHLKSIIDVKKDFLAFEMPLTNNVKIKMALLEAIIVDLPIKFDEKKAKNIGLFTGFVKDYYSLVHSELSMLEVLKISKGLTSCDFRLEICTTKIFTFVGAGLPISGIILHILTNGARVNLVDYNKSIVDKARELIKITELLGITQPGAIKVIHSDALNIEYIHRQNNNQVRNNQKQSIKSARLVLRTDILDLASSLSASVTNQIFKDNAKNVHLIRKRNVYGANEILYEKFVSDNNNFQLISKSATPQQILTQSHTDKVFTYLSSTDNINTTELYINKYCISNDKENILCG
jgi:hypothetical protein